MAKLYLYFFSILLAGSLFVPAARTQQEPDTAKKTVVYEWPVRENIGPGTLRKLNQAFEEVERTGADYLLLNMNTYGGLLDAADSIRSRLLTSPVKTLVYINNNAASAGALISIACDSIYMHQAATIGAASVVNQTGEVMPEKYQSYMRSLMRSTAETKGRDPKIAEAFVDPNVEVPGISEKGSLLTFTASEALKNGYCDGIAGSVEEALSEAGIGDYRLVKYQSTWIDLVVSFVMNPAVSGVLIMLILGGIYFELQTPGVGFPLLVSIAASLLYFLPLYIEGMAANWEILLFIVGVLLMAAELFVIPGFGVAGVLGIIFMVCGLAFSQVLNDFLNFSIAGEDVLKAVLLVLAAVLVTTVLAFIFGRNIFRSTLFKRLVLSDEQRSSEGYVGTEKTLDITGKTGTALTDLRPSGKIEIDSKRYDAMTEGGFLKKGTTVEVVRDETTSIIVREKSQG